MGKQDEIDYFKKVGRKGIFHSINKPFSDEYSGHLLSDFSSVIFLLPSPPAKLLDLGCGTGWTSIFFAKRGYDVLGIDISHFAIKHAEISMQKERIKNLDFIVGDYENLNFSNEFDCVIFFDSLHHSENPEKALKSAYNALKLNGICIAVEPGKNHLKSKHTQEIIKDYNLNESEMPPNKICYLGKKAGFRTVKVYPRSSLISQYTYKYIRRNRKIISNYFFTLLLVLYRMINRKSQGVVLMVK